MKCNNCGAELIDGASFCMNCGTKIDTNNNLKNNLKKPSKKIVILLISIVIAIVIVLSIIILIINKNLKNDIFWRDAKWGMTVDEISNLNRGCQETPTGLTKKDSNENVTKYYANILDLNDVNVYINYRLDSNECLNSIYCYIDNQSQDVSDEIVIEKVAKYLNGIYGECEIEKSTYSSGVLGNSWQTEKFNINLSVFTDNLIILKYQQK